MGSLIIQVSDYDSLSTSVEDDLALMVEGQRSNSCLLRVSVCANLRAR